MKGDTSELQSFFGKIVNQKEISKNELPKYEDQREMVLAQLFLMLRNNYLPAYP